MDMPVKRKRGPTRKNKKETKRAIPISQLVPSELFLDRESVEKAKSTFESGNAVPPIVVRISRLFYVLDGNHRVKAVQELGKNASNAAFGPSKRSATLPTTTKTLLRRRSNRDTLASRNCLGDNERKEALYKKKMN